MNKLPFIIGLTGQSGAGKSTVSDILKECGVSVIDCDKLARKVTLDSSECNKELNQFFPECFDERLHLDRRKMADIIFSDEKKLRLQNSIIFKYITKEIEEILNDCNKDFLILDAPTLFQSGLNKRCKAVVGVLSDKEKRFERIKIRDGISDESILLRFSSQKDDDFFINNCDIIIYNNAGFKELEKKTKEALKQIEEILNDEK